MTSFPEAARVELANPQLRANLRRATDTIREKRARVVGEVPDWEELREAGRAIKADVMARLDEYLVEFEAAVVAAGGNVHWARDAAEANAVVGEIARSHGVSEVVKMKSLTTDEIGLNDALAAVGIHALETDFAELILQLDGEQVDVLSAVDSSCLMQIRGRLQRQGSRVRVLHLAEILAST